MHTNISSLTCEIIIFFLGQAFGAFGSDDLAEARSSRMALVDASGKAPGDYYFRGRVQ